MPDDHKLVPEVGRAMPNDRKLASGAARPTSSTASWVGLAQRKPTKARKQLGTFAIHEDDNSAMSDSDVLRGKIIPT
ncbi:hypothetical protein NNRS527_01949 [Nitrosospira sp. NRS527]|nr:hypothetical protein NNRS527_01949 [Nitrosospira sp. NRS527]